MSTLSALSTLNSQSSGTVDKPPFQDFRVSKGLKAPAPPAGVPFWGDVPESWDAVKLGANYLPGVCEVTGHCKARNDKKDVPGKHGVTTTQKGLEPAEVIITVTMWTSNHLLAFAALVPLIRPKPGDPNTTPMGILHPATTLLGVNSVIVDSVGLPERRGGGDIYSVRITCHESFPDTQAKKAKTTTPTQTAKGALQVKVDNAQALQKSPATTQPGPSKLKIVR